MSNDEVVSIVLDSVSEIRKLVNSVEKLEEELKETTSIQEDELLEKSKKYVDQLYKLSKKIKTNFYDHYNKLHKELNISEENSESDIPSKKVAKSNKKETSKDVEEDLTNNLDTCEDNLVSANENLILNHLEIKNESNVELESKTPPHNKSIIRLVDLNKLLDPKQQKKTVSFDSSVIILTSSDEESPNVLPKIRKENGLKSALKSPLKIQVALEKNIDLDKNNRKSLRVKNNVADEDSNSRKSSRLRDIHNKKVNNRRGLKKIFKRSSDKNFEIVKRKSNKRDHNASEKTKSKESSDNEDVGVDSSATSDEEENLNQRLKFNRKSKSTTDSKFDKKVLVPLPLLKTEKLKEVYEKNKDYFGCTSSIRGIKRSKKGSDSESDLESSQKKKVKFHKNQKKINSKTSSKNDAIKDESDREDEIMESIEEDGPDNCDRNRNENTTEDIQMNVDESNTNKSVPKINESEEVDSCQQLEGNQKYVEENLDQDNSEDKQSNKNDTTENLGTEERKKKLKKKSSSKAKPRSKKTAPRDLDEEEDEINKRKDKKDQSATDSKNEEKTNTEKTENKKQQAKSKTEEAQSNNFDDEESANDEKSDRRERSVCASKDEGESNSYLEDNKKSKAKPRSKKAASNNSDDEESVTKDRNNKDKFDDSEDNQKSDSEQEGKRQLELKGKEATVSDEESTDNEGDDKKNNSDKSDKNELKGKRAIVSDEESTDNEVDDKKNNSDKSDKNELKGKRAIVSDEESTDNEVDDKKNNSDKSDKNELKGKQTMVSDEESTDNEVDDKKNNSDKSDKNELKGKQAIVSDDESTDNEVDDKKDNSNKGDKNELKGKEAMVSDEESTDNELDDKKDNSNKGDINGEKLNVENEEKSSLKPKEMKIVLNDSDEEKRNYKTDEDDKSDADSENEEKSAFNKTEGKRKAKPKGRKVILLSDSDEEKRNDKTDEDDKSDADSENEEKSAFNKTEGKRKAKPKGRKVILLSDSDEDDKTTNKRSGKKDSSDSDIESDDTKIGKVQKKKKTKKRTKKAVLSDSDENKNSEEKSGDEKSNSSSDEKETSENEKENNTPKKRSRIKKSENSSSDSEEISTRKQIRKVLGKDSLSETTKQAELEEKERKSRIAEKQKKYNRIFEEKKDAVVESVVLDYDEKTKEPLISVHKNIVKNLKPHQVSGIQFMYDACFESLDRLKKSGGSGCILAHCMGLGKTLQVVSLTHTLLKNSAKTKVERIMVVCPINTVLNWKAEYQKWVPKKSSLEVYELATSKKNYERQHYVKEWYGDGGVLIIGYTMFRNLSNPANKRLNKKMRTIFQEGLVDPGPDLVICDEGHLLKNEKTNLSIAMNRIKTARRIVLTGTPLQNNLKEYWCMVQFIKPNLLGTYKEYMNRFVNPITNGQYTDSTHHDTILMRKRSHVLHKLLDGVVQRRDYSVLEPYLPPKQEYVLFLKLSDIQIKLYKHYMERYAKKSDGTNKTSFLFTDFQQLQRICTHPRVLLDKSKEKKEKWDDEEESEGSLKDFIDDGDLNTSSASSNSGSTSESESDGSKPKKTSKARVTRAAAAQKKDNNEDSDEEVVEVPKEWWQEYCDGDELDNIINSGKMSMLFEILKECDEIGDKILVFSQSLYTLNCIEYFLDKIDEATQQGDPEKIGGYTGRWELGLDYFRLDGSSSCDNRAYWCDTFNSPDNTRARLFLISTKAGGLGINLVAANRVIIFDVSWNPSHDIQSIYRVYRFGQTKPCYIYRFVTYGAMEMKIYERQVTKQAISKRVIDEQQIDRHYNQNDLQELYKCDLEPAERPTPMVPKDVLLGEMLQKYDKIIYKYHLHQSLLENKQEECLNEEERKAAWDEFENEKVLRKTYTSPFFNAATAGANMNNMSAQAINVALTNIVKRDNPTWSDAQIKGIIPALVRQLQIQIEENDMSMYQRVVQEIQIMNQAKLKESHYQQQVMKYYQQQMLMQKQQMLMQKQQQTILGNLNITPQHLQNLFGPGGNLINGSHAYPGGPSTSSQSHYANDVIELND